MVNLRKIKPNILALLLSIFSVYSIITCDLPNTQGAHKLCQICQVRNPLGRYLANSLAQRYKGLTCLHLAACVKNMSFQEIKNTANPDEFKEFINAKSLAFEAKSYGDQLLDNAISNLVGSTPLFLAAFIHNPEKIKFLLANGADININGPDDNTVLHAAVANIVEDDEFQIETLELLIDKKGSLPNSKNNNNQTPQEYMILRNSANTEQRQRIEKMLKFEDHSLPLPKEDDLQKWVRIIRPAVGRLSDYILIAEPEIRGFNLWHIAACGTAASTLDVNDLKKFLNGSEEHELLRKILNTQSKAVSEGLTQNEINSRKITNILRGSTPLFLAALVHNKQMVEFLLDKNVDVTIRGPGGNTVLHAAVANVDNSQDQIDIVKLLLAKDSELMKQKNKSGQTPLDYMNSRGGRNNELESLLGGAEQASLPEPVSHLGESHHVKKNTENELSTKLGNLATKLSDLKQKLHDLAQKLISLENSVGKTAKKSSNLGG